MARCMARSQLSSAEAEAKWVDALTTCNKELVHHRTSIIISRRCLQQSKTFGRGEKEAKKHGSQLIDQTRGRKQIIWLSLANSRCVTKESVAIHMSKTGQECANVACGPHNLSGQCAYLKRFVDVSSNLRNFFCTHFTPGVKTWLEIYS